MAVFVNLKDVDERPEHNFVMIQVAREEVMTPYKQFIRDFIYSEEICEHKLW